MGGKGLWVCPYNKAHTMDSFHRVQTHLAKCRKNYPNQKHKACLFNATHIMLEPELEQHMMTCPDNKAFLREKVIVPNEFVPPPATEPIDDNSFSIHAGTEVWEVSNTNKPGYDPSLEFKHKAIMCKPMPCAGKATQREFRKRDVERLERLEKGLPPEVDEPKQKEEEKKPSKALPTPTVKSSTAKQLNKTEQHRGASADNNTPGLMRPVKYSNRRCIVGEIEEDVEPATSKKAYMLETAASPDHFGHPVAMVDEPTEARGRGIASFGIKSQLSPSERIGAQQCGVGRGRGRGMDSDIVQPGGNHTEVGPVRCLGGFGRGYSAAPNGSREEPEYFVPNDLGSHDAENRKKKNQYLEQLGEIHAILKRQEKGVEPTEYEKALLRSEDIITESLEKLNLDP